MDSFDRSTLMRLAGLTVAPCVSLFLRTHPAGQEGEQDAIRLKNLLREAERQLAGHWLSAGAARALTKPAADLPNDASFWQHRSQGLAIFLAPNWFEAYRVAPPFEEQVTVANRFCLRPMLPLLEEKLDFFLLVISENRAALYAADEHTIQAIEVPGLPANLAEALNYAGADRGAQVHSAMHDARGKQGAVFHGQGGQPDKINEDRLAYSAVINNAITAWLGDSTCPLLLAGVDRLTSLYRQKNSYKLLLNETFAGSHDCESQHQLHQGAWKIVQPLLHAETATIAQRYAERLGSPRATDDPIQVVTAARVGRVDGLLYDPRAELFGQIGEEGENQITGNADDEDLVQAAAVETLRHGGAIGSMNHQDVPTNSPLAAILRY